MQIQAVNTYDGATLGFAAISDGLAVVEQAGYVRLLFTSRNDSRLGALTLAVQQPQSPPNPQEPVIGIGPGEDLVLQQTPSLPVAYVFSSYDGVMRQATVGATGLPGLTKATDTDIGLLFGVTAMEVFERGATDVVVTAQKAVPGLRLFLLDAAGDMHFVGSLNDGQKTYLADVADIAGLTIDGHSYLLVASVLENGLTCFEIKTNGSATLIDSFGARDGLPLAGPTALQSVQIGGVSYVVVASTLSDSLTVLRVNDMGVMFLADHLIDDRNTRFEAVAALDMFSWAGRAFVVAAGADAGLSVIEVLPGGRLSPVLSHALETGAGIANVTGIEVTMIGDTAAILLTDARGDRIHHLSLDMGGVGGLIIGQGGTVNGSALDDRILGGGQSETLQGNAGADFLHDGGGNDLLLCGTGADVFVFGRDGSPDRLGDFQAGLDRIDVSDWGRIYSADALSLSATPTGAIVSYGNETLTITRSGGGSLTLSDADFLF